MNNKKHEDKRSFLLKAWEIFGDIFMLNVMFVVCSLPIVTIGASLCALYAVSMRMVNREDGAIVQSFLNEFKRNWKQGTIAWLLVVFAIVGIWGEIFYMTNFTGVMTKVYTVVVAIEIVALALILPFLFPLIARYENTLWNTIRNSFLLSVSNLGKWVKIFIAWFGPIVLSIAEPKVFFNTWYLWLIIAFGLIAYGTSHTILRVFDRVGDVKEENIQRQEREQKEAQKKYKNISKRAMAHTDGNKRKAAEPVKENKNE